MTSLGGQLGRITAPHRDGLKDSGQSVELKSCLEQAAEVRIDTSYAWEVTGLSPGARWPLSVSSQLVHSIPNVEHWTATHFQPGFAVSS